MVSSVRVAYDPTATNTNDIAYIATSQVPDYVNPELTLNPGAPTVYGLLTVTGAVTNGQAVKLPMIVGVSAAFSQVTIFGCALIRTLKQPSVRFGKIQAATSSERASLFPTRPEAMFNSS